MRLAAAAAALALVALAANGAGANEAGANVVVVHSEKAAAGMECASADGATEACFATEQHGSEGEEEEEDKKLPRRKKKNAHHDDHEFRNHHNHHEHKHAHDHHHDHAQGEAHSCSHNHAHDPAHAHAHDLAHAHAHDPAHAHAHDPAHAHAHDPAHAHAHDHDHHHHHHGGAKAKSARGTTEIRPSAEVWKDALLATIIVTMLGNASILFFLWIDVSESALKTMVGFATGGLLGDVFLHLLPHASSDAHDGSGLWVLAGIFAFFAVEKFVRISSFQALAAKKSEKTERRKKAGQAASLPEPPLLPSPTTFLFGVKPGAILNLAADTAHNFVDGMALAASFKISASLGWTMTLAVTLHEVPHELGDFAVLVSLGFTKYQAFFAQFGSALGAFLGCIFGLVVTSTQPVAMLNFTGGGFIYVALCDILPDLLQDATSYTQAAKELMAIVLGVYLMHLIADWEPH